MKDKLFVPYVIVSPDGLYYVGLHSSEVECWEVALGWPHEDDIKFYKSNGWYCTDATVSWKNPKNQSSIPKAKKLCYTTLIVSTTGEQDESRSLF